MNDKITVTVDGNATDPTLDGNTLIVPPDLQAAANDIAALVNSGVLSVMDNLPMIVAYRAREYEAVELAEGK